MLNLVDKISENTGMQDRLQSAVEESAKPRFAFCKWMGAELAFIDANLWFSFQREAFDMVTRYHDLQPQQPAPPPPLPPPMAVPLMLPQQQIQHPPRPVSVPPHGSPPFWQPSPAAWQHGPVDYTGWPTFSHQLNRVYW